MIDLTTLFCGIDDFWKHFRSDWEQHLISKMHKHSSKTRSSGYQGKFSVTRTLGFILKDVHPAAISADASRGGVLSASCLLIEESDVKSGGVLVVCSPAGIAVHPGHNLVKN